MASRSSGCIFTGREDRERHHPGHRQLAIDYSPDTHGRSAAHYPRVDSAAAQVGAFAAGSRRIQRQLEFLAVRAPLTGVVTERNIDAGSLVSAGTSEPLYKLASVDRGSRFLWMCPRAARPVWFPDWPPTLRCGERPPQHLRKRNAHAGKKNGLSQGDSDTAAAFELNLRGVFPQPPAPAPVEVKVLAQNIQEKMGDDPFEIGGQFIAGLRNFKSDQVSHGQIQQVLGDVRESVAGPWPGGADIAEGAAWESETLELALGKFLKDQRGTAA